MSDTPLDIEDFAALRDYLLRTQRVQNVEAMRLTNLAGGVSNRTVLIECPGQAWVLKQALAKLRVKVDWFSDPDRILREALGIRWLQRLAPAGAITPLIFEDAVNHLLAMSAVPQPHENWKTQLLSGVIEPDSFIQFGALLGTIQRNADAQSAEIAAVFSDNSFFESLRLEPYYAYAASQVPRAADFLNDLIAATRQRRIALVHGDYSPKNILVHDRKLVLLDHEVIHFGDPSFDVGFALTHFISKARHLPAYKASLRLGALQFWQSYRDALGQIRWTADLEPFCVRHTLGCLLARVAGRSPLEYLDDSERRAQQEQVLKAIPHPPETIRDLLEQFTQ